MKTAKSAIDPAPERAVADTNSIRSVALQGQHNPISTNENQL
jgi:hypothetical protein